MKILWLCNIVLPIFSNELGRNSENLGGWLTGALEGLIKDGSFNISVCFPVINLKKMKTGQVNKVTFFAFPQTELNPSVYNSKIELYLNEIIQLTQPDVVHIFGTEFAHTLAMVNVCERNKILDKVVINIQGLCSIISMHYLIGIPIEQQKRYTFHDWIKRDNLLNQKNKFTKRGENEILALQKVQNVIGRTEWDFACTKQINPNLIYFSCNENLRNSFYNNKWSINKCKLHSIFVSQWDYPIKGFHFMLEAMPIILLKHPDTHLFTTGVNPLELRKLSQKARLTSYQKFIAMLIEKYELENYVTFLGNLSEEKMCECYLAANVFVSPSLIENESNSLSEAKILGVPSVASYVGGVVERINHGVDGFLYQQDAPYMMAHFIDKIFSSDSLAIQFSENARKTAMIMHNIENNISQLSIIYSKIYSTAKVRT